MPVKVKKRGSGYVTVERSGRVASQHTSKPKAEAAARIRNAADRKKRKR